KQALKVLNRVAREMLPQGRRNPGLAAAIAAHRSGFKASNTDMETSSAFPMMPERILADLRAVMPRDAFLTADVGWNKNGVGQQFPIYEPGSILTPGGFATMGFGPSAALGVQLAHPDRAVISLVGHGRFRQHPALPATAAARGLGVGRVVTNQHAFGTLAGPAEGLGVVWGVMNNNAFGTIAGLQKAHYGLTYGTTFPKTEGEQTPDYAAIARAYGVEGVRLRAAEEFRPALEAAIASGRPT